jgi:hypothetical protein
MNTRPPVTYRVGIQLLGTCPLAAAVLGCFQGTSKFYLESDIVTDGRLQGRFEAPTNPDQPSLVITSAQKGHYLATYRENEYWIKLDLVLFRIGTNYFVDISHLADNGSPRNPGGAPGGVAALILATRDNTHSVLKTKFTESGMEIRYSYGNPPFLAMKKDPNLKWKVVEGGGMLLDSTERVRSLVAKFANDESMLGVFGRTPIWTRSSKEQ